jgi:hypothetical protein
MGECAFRPSRDVTRFARGVDNMGFVGGRLSIFADFSEVETFEASTVGLGVRGVETVGDSRGGRSPRKRLEDLRGGEVMAESAEDRHPIPLGDLWGLENIFMLVSCQHLEYVCSMW